MLFRSEKEHPGILPTCGLIAQDFYIHRLQEEVARYIANCEACQYGKRMPAKFKTEYGQVARQEEKLTCWSMDLLHLPLSYGYQYLLVMQDIGTLWVEVYPLKRATEAKVMEKLMQEFFPRYRPKEIRSDKGPEFKGKALRALIESNGCEFSFGISGYSNDKAVERCLATINKLIRVYSVESNLRQDQWVTLLPRILLHMRTIPDSTGESPYLRVYGQKIGRAHV